MFLFFFRSADGNSVFICSTDGYCTIASFASNEFGKVFTGDCADKKTENENVEVLLLLLNLAVANIVNCIKVNSNKTNLD
jgi:hypothetical protein